MAPPKLNSMQYGYIFVTTGSGELHIILNYINRKIYNIKCSDFVHQIVANCLMFASRVYNYVFLSGSLHMNCSQTKALIDGQGRTRTCTLSSFKGWLLISHLQAPLPSFTHRLILRVTRFTTIYLRKRCRACQNVPEQEPIT